MLPFLHFALMGYLLILPPAINGLKFASVSFTVFHFVSS